MIALTKSAGGILTAMARIVARDPITVFGVLPIESARDRLRYRAEVDSWELRFIAVSGRSRSEVRRLVEILPTDRPGFPEIRVLRWAYDMLCQGLAWEEIVEVAERAQAVKEPE